MSVVDGQARIGGRVVWDEVNIEIGQGQFAAILGPNGSGKTTLLRVLLGELALARGSASVLGDPPGAHKQQIGYLPQRRHFEPGTRIRGIDLVRLGLDGARWGLPLRRRRRRADRAGAGARRRRRLRRRPIGSLSGGEQQRLLIAQALVSEPRLLILDEPLDSLDLPNQSAVAALLERISREQGVAVLLVAHDVNPLLAYLDRVVYFGAGRAVVGDPREVIEAGVLSRLYGVPVEVLQTADGRLVVVGAPEAAGPSQRPPCPRPSGMTLAAPPGAARRPAAVAGPGVRPHELTCLPVHGARAAGGNDRGGDVGADRLVHGPAPPDVRRPHAVGDGLPRRRRGTARSGSRRRPASSSSPALAALAIGAARPGRRSGNRGQESAVTGTVQAVGLACGFLFLSLYQGVLGSYESLLFGSFLGITSGQVLALLGVAAVAILLLALAGRPLLFASVDEGVARARGVPTRALGIGFLLLLGMAVAETAQITGALLVFALLVAPPATAQLLTARTGLGLALSVILGVLVDVAGPRAGLLLRIPRRLLHHDGRVRHVRARARLLRAALDAAPAPR